MQNQTSNLEDRDFVVLNINNRQYIACPNEHIVTDRITKESPINILLGQKNKKLFVGQPNIEDWGVKIEILENKKDQKINVRRFKSKSRYRKSNGHRQTISVLRIIDFGNNVKTEIKNSTSKKQ